MSILIQNVILNRTENWPETRSRAIDIYIEDNKIEKIAPKIDKRAEQKIDGKGGKAVLPGLINSHTHAGMTLLRGHGDDLPLDKWLKTKVWPLEAKATEDDIYWGTKLACLEMLKTGTCFFNGMFWHEQVAFEAVKEIGIGAVIGMVLLDASPQGNKEKVERVYNSLAPHLPENVKLSVAPHAVYTVNRENLIWAREFARAHNLILHTHSSETKKEVDDCFSRYGLRPVEFLDNIDFLGQNTVLAHCVWLSQKEIEILARAGSSAVYCPASNMKLAVAKALAYRKLKKARVNISLGTDGPASNNNLDMFEEMKIGSLLQKHHYSDSACAPANEVIRWASENGAKALKLDTGQIAQGNRADLILIDLNEVALVPGHNLISDIVYSVSGNVVSDVVCNGQILMRDRKVAGENKIIQQAAKRAKSLIALNYEIDSDCRPEPSAASPE